MSTSVSIRVLLTQADERLLALASEGHERAFEALVHRYRRQLLAYCRRLLLSGDRAEDALQQAFLQAWLALQDGSTVRDPRPWLYRIVHNTALNALRVSGYDYATLSETLHGEDAPEDDLDRRIAVREALAGLAALPPLQREALLRTAVDGHTHEQAARELGVSQSALRGLVYRARITVRAAVAAVTPTPLLAWALDTRGAGGISVATHLAEVGAGGGSVGVGAALIKGGTIVVAAGALAGGLVAIPRTFHQQATSPRFQPKLAHPRRVLAAGTGNSAIVPSAAADQGPSGVGGPIWLSHSSSRAGSPLSSPVSPSVSYKRLPGQLHARGRQDSAQPHLRSSYAQPPQGTQRTSGPGSSPNSGLSSTGQGGLAGDPQSTLPAHDPGGTSYTESQGPLATTAGSQEAGSQEWHSHDGAGGSGSGSSSHPGSSEDSGGDGSSATSESSAKESSSNDCGDCGHTGTSSWESTSSGQSSGDTASHDSNASHNSPTSPYARSGEDSR